MAKIKILHIITRMDWGGSPDGIKETFRLFDPEVFDMYLVYGLTKNPDLDTKNFFEAFKEKLIFLPSLRREINPLMDLVTFLKLCGIFQQYKPDLVNTHTTKAGILGRLAAFCVGIRKIVHFPHGNIFYGYYNRIISGGILILERCFSIFTKKLVVFTEAEKDVLLKLRLARADKIEVIKPGIDFISKLDDSWLVKKRVALGIKPGALIVGMVSRLEPIKGVDFFVLAALEVLKRRSNVFFIITGEGSLRSKLETEVCSAGREKEIIFTGWRNDAQSLMGLMDILVQPSLNEAIGRVLLEAQGLGVSVIATKVGGIPDIICDGVTGILIPQENTKALVDAILDLLDDQAKRQRLSEKGRQWVRDNFSLREMIVRLAGFYKEEVFK